ncbi:MAG: dNTP triphosphohydrolase [Candidatus Peregrinibacteria bacterium]
MLPLSQRIAQANALLAPYAVRHGEGRGREVSESEDATRFPFQRDRDRIIHTQAFRRLKGKTQVFVFGQSDHFRTRMTHTMEVAQISRDIARTLALNEDLAEAIALAHDLGHPPFGHAGESALDAWMRTRGKSFEHNEQSSRIVTVMERHSSLYQGLNLNSEILDGLRKHSTPHDAPLGGNEESGPTLEAQVVNIADEIAYTGHDIEDGLSAGLFSLGSLLQVPLALSAHDRAKVRGTEIRGSIIDLLVSDLYEASDKEIVSQRITTVDDVRAARAPLIRFSLSMAGALKELRGFLTESMYFHPSVLEVSQEAMGMLTEMCNWFLKNPSPKVLSLQSKTDGALDEAIKDYVSGMTDHYALFMANRAGITVELPAWEHPVTDVGLV